jgi:hypothetical protein
MQRLGCVFLLLQQATPVFHIESIRIEDAPAPPCHQPDLPMACYLP